MEEPSTGEDATSLDQFVRKASDGQVIRKIYWEGNTIYSDEFLTEKLGLQSGDVYDSIALNQQLSYNPEGGDVSSFYMDQGYLFFRIDVQKTELENGKLDLMLNIYEGEPIVVSEIRIQGNREISREAILEEISIKPGELFNRSKLVNSQRAIALMGYFDPEKVGINPVPDPENHEVAIEFVLKRNID